jgi:hypothetical protein
MRIIEFTFKDNDKEVFTNVIDFRFDDDKYYITTKASTYTVNYGDILTYRDYNTDEDS